MLGLRKTSFLYITLPMSTVSFISRYPAVRHAAIRSKELRVTIMTKQKLGTYLKSLCTIRKTMDVHLNIFIPTSWEQLLKASTLARSRNCMIGKCTSQNNSDKFADSSDSMHNANLEIKSLVSMYTFRVICSRRSNPYVTDQEIFQNRSQSVACNPNRQRGLRTSRVAY